MCGRFALGIPREAIAERFGLATVPHAPARYNIAPGQLVEAVLAAPDMHGGSLRRMGLFRWGLVPFWAKEPSIGSRLIIARAETAAEKPAFRAALRRRRCLVPAQGIYEWSDSAESGQAKKKRPPRAPWFVTSASGELLALAAIWEHFESPAGEIIDSLAVLTCEPNDLIRPLHHRMCVLVRPEDDARWLDPHEEDPRAIADILAPRPWPDMKIYRVDAQVNSPTHDGPELIVPVAEEE